MQPSSVTIPLAACRCSGNASKKLALRSRVIASDSSISIISIMFSNAMNLPMDRLRLVIKILPFFPEGMYLSTRAPSALSNTITHAPWRKDIHWRTDSTEPSTPDACAAGVLDMPFRDVVMLSWEEASTQNTCEKLEQELNLECCK